MIDFGPPVLKIFKGHVKRLTRIVEAPDMIGAEAIGWSGVDAGRRHGKSKIADQSVVFWDRMVKARMPCDRHDCVGQRLGWRHRINEYAKGVVHR